MKNYAQLNENNICVGISQLTATVDSPGMVEITAADVDYIWRKYENGQWSTEKFEPQTTAPLTDFEELKQRQDLMQAALDDLILGGVL